MNRRQQGLIKEAEQRVQQNQFSFTTVSLAILTVVYGVYILFNPGYIEMTINEALSFLNENTLSYLMLAGGTIKLFGLAINNNFLRRLGIVLINVCWGILLIIATVYALGIGYPSPNFIIYGYLLILCLRASYREDFN